MTLTRIQNRRGTAAQWIEGNPVLAPGEIGLELDTGKFKIGTGLATWTDLSYGLGSAYDVAVANGFIGTESQWLDSLVGPQGPIGPTGFTYPHVITAASSSIVLNRNDHAGGFILLPSLGGTGTYTITVNSTSGFLDGEHVAICRDGTNEVNFVFTDVVYGSVGNRLKLDEQYSIATVICVGTNSYRIFGDLKL